MQLHANCVAFEGRGLLIRGASGSGKSSLSLSLMAIGAELVADDRTDIDILDDWPVASAPEALFGMIEARGVGILAAQALRSARLYAVVDLDHLETDRFPVDRTTIVAGHPLPCIHKSESTHFVAALRQYLIGGKVAQ